jgi:hypothetical protein
MKKMLLFIFGFTAINCYAQISHGGEPFSIQNNLTPAANYINLDTDVSKLIEEDLITDKHKDISYRFGKVVTVNIGLTNSGTWETLTNGDRIWRLIIKSPGATSINLNYDAFMLPKNATFFIYNKNTTLGAFTKENNKSHGKFATTLLEGDQITLEYYEPLSQTGNGVIHISSLVHGYRDLYKKQKAFGSSGGCNVNAICDTNYWGNEIRSTIMQLRASNSRNCSAALINNTLQDGTPYVLIANHCTPSPTDIYMFNYESADCANSIDGPTTQTVVGATMVSSNSLSDFYLVKLSSVPPSNYNAFYAGWSNINTPPLKGTGIHHPSGDVKKISHDFDNLVEDGYYTAGNNHWKVNDWNTGTTEGGSSGSPIFDQNHRIVGQLHGGNAACGNDAFDYYGKFSFSWDTDSDTLKQLKYWLDPNNSGATVLDGFDPNGATLTTDAILLDIEGIPNYVCGDSIKPQITIRNNGSDSLTTLIINYAIDGATPTQYNWTGNLASYQIDMINLPTTIVTNGAHTFTASCSNPNSNTDQNLLNDSATSEFIINDNPLYATLNLKTDDYGAETSWIIKENSSGDTLVKSQGYSDVSGGQNYTENICLYDGCFTFILNDAAGDGYCCSFGSGRIFLTEDANGDTLLIDSTFNSSSISYSFCMGTATGINELSTTNFNLYPNPNDGNFIVSSEEEIEEITIINVLGKVIYNRKNIYKNKIDINLKSVDKGIYFVNLITENQKRKTIKIIIN